MRAPQQTLAFRPLAYQRIVCLKMVFFHCLRWVFTVFRGADNPSAPRPRIAALDFPSLIQFRDRMPQGERA